MTPFTAELIARPRDQLTAYDAVPDIFLPLINDVWLQSDSARVFMALVRDRHQTAWTELGAELLVEVLSCGRQVGVCLDGDWPPEMILRWLEESDLQGAPAAVDVQWLRSAHPVLRTTRNVRWTSLHQTAPPWLSSVWRQTGSDRFHVGCDLMAVAYQVDIVARVRWDEPSTLASFGATLADAAAWVIPLGDDLGFVVGARAWTPLYSSLVNSG
jgi:hypothetical protein